MAGFEVITEDETDGKIRGIEFKHNGREGAGRQSTKVHHSQIRNVADGSIGIYARLEEDLNQTYAGQRARFDVIDAASKRKEPFVAVGDIGFDLLRWHARVEGGNNNNRYVDLREEVDRHAKQCCYAHHNDDETGHQDKEWI